MTRRDIMQTLVVIVCIFLVGVYVFVVSSDNKSKELVKVENLMRDGFLHDLKDIIKKDSNGKLNEIESYEQASAMLLSARKYDIDWRIVYALARSEISDFDYSFHRIYDNGLHDGYGNMQVLLSTAKMFEKDINARTLTVPSRNYDIGVAYFKSMYGYFGKDLKKAVQSYKRGYKVDSFEEKHWVIFNKFYNKIKSEV